MKKKNIFITGATSGIGKSCAALFAGDGHRLILSGRRGERLVQLGHDLYKRFETEFYLLEFDIRNRPDVEKAIASLPPSWRAIDVLINNAGLALGLSEIGQGCIDEWDQMIDTNIKGLLYISRAVMPGMMSRKSGHIINIGSIAGRETYPKGSVYCATKHAVDSITKGMRIDLLPYGIKVSQVSPGATETEFSLVRFHGDEQRAKEVYKGFTPLGPEDVALTVKFIADMPAHANIDDLLLMPARQASATIIHREQ